MVRFPQPETWLGFYHAAKTKDMNDKNLERYVDNLLDNLNETIIILVKKIETLENDLVELDEQHEQSLKVAFEKGYEEGVKYTDGLISDERFPF